MAPKNSNGNRTEQAILDVMLAMRGFDETQDIETLWGQFTDYAEGLGADLITYHHFKADYAPGYRNEAFHSKGFPDHWLKTYFSKNYIDFDPIIMRAKLSTRPFRWFSIENLWTLTEQQKAYMLELQSWMTGDGYGVPVFGPSGQNGYFGIGSMMGVDDWDERAHKYLHMACESFHIRYYELQIMALEKDFTLTEREQIILENMALGRSDALICGLIGVQLNSVQSGVRRILKKMKVNDRSAAVLRGVGCGLLDPKLIRVEA